MKRTARSWRLVCRNKQAWSAEEEARLRQGFGRLGWTALLAILPGRSKRSCQAKAKMLDLPLPGRMANNTASLGYYGAEETELLRAVLTFRDGNGGKPPTLLEGFRILKKLGWSKG